LQDPERLNKGLEALKKDYQLLEERNSELNKELSTLATSKSQLILNPISSSKQKKGFKIVDYQTELQHVSILELNGYITVFAHRPNLGIKIAPEFAFAQGEVKKLKTVNLRKNIAIDVVNGIFEMMQRPDVTTALKIVNGTWMPNNESNYKWLHNTLEDHINV
jgi:hypothetical protein